jgi:hypothetical protein
MEVSGGNFKGDGLFIIYRELLFEFFLVSLKSAKKREKEEFTHQKYLKNSEKKNTNPFLLKRLPYELLQFLAVAGNKLKKKISEKS